MNMLSVNRNVCLALVLLLLLGHATLTLHVTTHIPVDPTSCEYCAGHGNPGHAIPSSTIEWSPPFLVASGSGYRAPVTRTPEIFSYRQRAPPDRV